MDNLNVETPLPIIEEERLPSIHELAPLRTFDAIANGAVRTQAAGNFSGWQNAVASIGANNSIQQYSKYIVNRLSYQDCAALATDTMISKANSILVKEIFKPSGKWIGGVDEDNFETVLSSFQFWQTVKTACLRSLEYGGAFIYIDTADNENDLSKPLYFNEQTLSSSRLLGFRVLEPWQVAPIAVNSFNPLRADYMRPSLWWVLGAPSGVHHTRLIPVVFFDVPTLIKPLYNYLGLPMSYYMASYVSSADTVRQSIADIALRFRTKFIKTTAQKIADGETRARVKFINESQNNLGVVLLSKDEEYIETITPIAGLNQTLTQMYQLMTAATRGIPVTKLLGTAPVGMNATGEYDESNFYDVVEGYAQDIVRPVIEHLAHVISCFALSRYASLTYKFNPRKMPTAKEEAEIQNLKADYIGKLIDRNIVTPEEAGVAIQDNDLSLLAVDFNDDGRGGLEQDTGLEPMLDEWKEGDPRKNNGEFGQGGSSGSAIEISGNELGKYNDIKELRQKATKYYKDNIQGTIVKRDDIGEIRFSKKGVDETVSHSNEEKLLIIPKLQHIIQNGKSGTEEKPKHERRDGIVAFIPITHSITLKEKKVDVEVLVGKDAQGHLYYDLFTNNFRQKPHNDAKKPPTGSWDNSPSPLRATDRNDIVSIDNIVDDAEEINIFLEIL